MNRRTLLKTITAAIAAIPLPLLAEKRGPWRHVSDYSLTDDQILADMAARCGRYPKPRTFAEQIVDDLRDVPTCRDGVKRARIGLVFDNYQELRRKYYDDSFDMAVATAVLAEYGECSMECNFERRVERYTGDLCDIEVLYLMADNLGLRGYELSTVYLHNTGKLTCEQCMILWSRTKRYPNYFSGIHPDDWPEIEASLKYMPDSDPRVPFSVMQLS